MRWRARPLCIDFSRHHPALPSQSHLPLTIFPAFSSTVAVSIDSHNRERCVENRMMPPTEYWPLPWLPAVDFCSLVHFAWVPYRSSPMPSQIYFCILSPLWCPSSKTMWYFSISCDWPDLIKSFDIYSSPGSNERFSPVHCGPFYYHWNAAASPTAMWQMHWNKHKRNIYRNRNANLVQSHFINKWCGIGGWLSVSMEMYLLFCVSHCKSNEIAWLLQHTDVRAPHTNTPASI